MMGNINVFNKLKSFFECDARLRKYRVKRFQGWTLILADMIRGLNAKIALNMHFFYIMIFKKIYAKSYGVGFILYKYFPVMFCFRDIN